MYDDPLLVGIDVGTTSIKAIVFDATGKIVAQSAIATPTHYPRPNWAYYDPEELWQHTVQVLRSITVDGGIAGRIVSVAVASVAESMVPLDAHGQPVHHAIAWFDGRTAAQAQWLEQTIGRERLFALSGVALHHIFGLCKMLWLRDNEADAFARSALWLHMADYVAYRLCGVPATDYSLASRTLALDLGRLRWADDLLLEIGVAPTLFAQLRPSGSPLGPILASAAEQTGLPHHTQVGTGGHDHVCGALAAGVTQTGTVLDSLGTAEAIFLPTDKPVVDPQYGYQGYAQGVHVDGKHYFAMGGLNTSGACVDWFRGVVAAGVDYATLIGEAEQETPGCTGICFLPHLRLANAPHLDPKARGAFIGLNAGATRGRLFRAVMEGMAFEIRSTLEPLLAHTQTKVHSVYATGGGTRNHLLMRIKATVLKRTIHVISMEEATALGAAVLGGLAAGVYGDVADALGQLKITQTAVEPIADQVGVYDAIYRNVYQHMYEALKPLHHASYALQDDLSTRAPRGIDE